MPLRYAPLLLAFSLLAQAQAPIERRPPQPYANWPIPGSFRPHTLLLITTHDGVERPCRLRDFELYRVGCVAANFDREDVESIALAPKHYGLAGQLENPVLGLGAGLLGYGVLEGLGGGTGGKVPAIAGLSLLAASGVIHLVKLHHGHKPLKVIYVATGTSAGAL